ncbi:MAG: hypothetical protein ACTSQY_07125 [Candidatus Odinarchaeia archaeon]
MESDNIEEKFTSLMNKLQEVNIQLNETVRNIKDGLIPTFERSMADMKLSIDKLSSKNSQIIKRFEDQTDFLAKNFKVSIDSLKAIFDVNKFEDIINKSERLNETLESQLKEINIIEVTNELKQILDKINKKV